MIEHSTREKTKPVLDRFNLFHLFNLNHLYQENTQSLPLLEQEQKSFRPFMNPKF
jgi:hypothetical protein